MPITPDQAREIADAFRGIANDLSDYIHQEWDNLTPVQKQKLDSAEWDLRTDAFNFRTMAVGIVLNNMQQDLDNLKQATKQAKKAITDIKKVGSIIKVATGLVMLGGAIISQNPLAIVSASTELISTIQKL